MVPGFGLEQVLGGLFVRGGLLRAVGEQPAAHADAVHAGGFATVDLALVALGLALVADQAKAEAGIEALVFLRDHHFGLYLEIAHLQFAHHPYVDLGRQMQLAAHRLEGLHLGAGLPALGALSVKQRGPFFLSHQRQ